MSNNNAELKEQVVQAITAALALSKDEQENLRLDVGYKPLKKWTSARHAEIIVAIEDAFDIEVDELSIPRLNTVARIVEYVARKRAA